MKRIYPYLITLFFTVALTVATTQLVAQGPPPPPVPIDGGIGVLLLAGAGYGAYRRYKERNPGN